MLHLLTLPPTAYSILPQYQPVTQFLVLTTLPKITNVSNVELQQIS